MADEAFSRLYELIHDGCGPDVARKVEHLQSGASRLADIVLEWKGEPARLPYSDTPGPRCPVCCMPQRLGHDAACQMAAVIGTIRSEDPTAIRRSWP